MVPPIDLCKVLEGCGAGFLARALATDKNLPHVIAQAITHPGFALVEVVELCTEYAVKPNELTGKTLERILLVHHLPLGILRQSSDRKEFSASYKEKYHHQTGAGDTSSEYIDRRNTSSLRNQIGIVIAGTAGERIQLTAHLLAKAAVMSELHCTQKNDNPVTQGSGFSISEICISPSEIYYTGIDEPDVMIVTSNDGLNEVVASGMFARASERTMIITDAELSLPETKARTVRYPFRKSMTPLRAAAAAVYLALLLNDILPEEAFEETIMERYVGSSKAFKNDFLQLRETAQTMAKQ
jgi:Pyruvate/2-oxoacid:ferredoxin oxidoreductase gamma subunit